jgi:glycosyltransferase involved in cell wall biosynthesis
MIVQMTRTRNEAFIIKEMLPIWQRFADGFVFISDNSTDDTLEFLHANKEKYNILEILETNSDVAPEEYETNARQKLFDAARKYTDKLICMDSDEYLDGTCTKEQLEAMLEKNPDTTLMLQWIQYTSKNQRRVDSFWREVFHDRAGSYREDAKFGTAFSHSGHVPSASRAIRVDPNQLFVAHLQWLDKRWVGIKQYFWKVWDYVAHLEHGVHIINRGDYDVSVNNFNWEYEDFNVPLKIREDIYKTQDVKDNYKLEYIVEQTKKYNIMNLNDWGMGIHDYAIKQ